MPSVFDVANYVLRKNGPMTAMKLQKLVYYAQAWSLVWDEAPLFDQRIQAWANGPVVADLYREHKGQFTLTAESIKGDPDALMPMQRETLDKVLAFYGEKTSQWLSDLTHQERPWMEARLGLGAGERGEREIAVSTMAEYYGSL